MTKASDPFLSAIAAEVDSRKASEARIPPGYRLATMSEVGCFLDSSETFAKSRKIALKPDASEEGLAAFERNSLATHNKIEAEGYAVLVLVMMGHPIGTKSHRDRLQAWREQKLSLPSLSDFLGMRPVNGAGQAPRAEAARRETNEQLEARLERQRREKIEGVRLVKPTTIGR